MRNMSSHIAAKQAASGRCGRTLIAAFLVLLATSAAAQSGATFYVSTNGSDSNAGTIGSPWRHIQHAANSVTAGATVDVMGGIYQESVNIPVSGNSRNGYVVFQSYPGQTAIVDGTGVSCCGSSVQGLFNIINQSYVTISGFEIRNYTTANENDVPAGIWVTGAGSHIHLLNNKVHNITTTSEKNGNAFGISVYGTSATPISSLAISGNRVYNNRTGNSETIDTDGNVQNFTITNNIVHDNDNIGIDAIGFERVGPSGFDQSRNGEISDNIIYNISGITNPGEGNSYDANGIYCDGCTHVVIERNLIYAADLNIEVASEHKGHTSSYVTVRNNVLYRGNSCGISIGGYDSRRGGSDHVTIVNNTLFENDTKRTGSGEFQVQFYATNNIFENNILFATSQGLVINNYTNSESHPVLADYNVYYSPAGSNSQWLWNGKAYTGFATYQSVTKQDAHSSFANPDFDSISHPLNFDILPASPAVNAGINLGPSVVGTEDFAGNPRVNADGQINIGAYEQ